MFKSRAVEIHCCVSGCVGEKDLSLTVTVPEAFTKSAADDLATAYAASLALIWNVKKEQVQTSVSIVRTTREVERYYDLSMVGRFG